MNSILYNNAVKKIIYVKKNKPWKLICLSIVFLLPIIIIVALLHKFSPKYCLPSFNEFMLGCVAGGSVFAINYLISYLLRKKRNMNNENFKLPLTEYFFYSPITRIVLIILLAAIEEYIFRSYLLFFMTLYFSLPVAIIINASLFAICHYNSRVIELFLMGVMYCLLTVYTDNLFSAIIAHSINNIIVWAIKRKKWCNNLKILSK